MPIPRFYAPCAGEPFLPGTVCELSTDEARHARTVLRLRDGDAVELFDGAARLARGRLRTSGRREASVEIESVESSPPDPLHLTLAAPPPKGKRTLAMVEQCTELGVDAFLPLRCERSVSLGGDPGKWRQRAVEACKQCGRLTLPEILEPCDLRGLAGRFGEWERIFVASLAPGAVAAAEALATRPAHGSLLWIVGPEGGLTQEEERLLLEAGATPARIAPHILRIATAAALACGLSRLPLAAADLQSAAQPGE